MPPAAPFLAIVLTAACTAASFVNPLARFFFARFSRVLREINFVAALSPIAPPPKPNIALGSKEPRVYKP